MTDLQENIVIGRTGISGNLKHITGWTAFSGKVSERSGNYLAIHAAVPNVEGVTITVKVTNPVVLDPDGIVICRIADKSTQTITVTASKAGYADVTRVFELTGLTCAAS